MNGASDFSLDNRLALCADFVRDGAKVADIGTDHAYLPVWLCRIGYTVILAEYSGEVRTVSESDLFLYGLDPKNNSMHRRFIEGCVRRLLKQAKGNPVCAETARILEESFK